MALHACAALRMGVNQRVVVQLAVVGSQVCRLWVKPACLRLPVAVFPCLCRLGVCHTVSLVLAAVVLPPGCFPPDHDASEVLTCFGKPAQAGLHVVCRSLSKDTLHDSAAGLQT